MRTAPNTRSRKSFGRAFAKLKPPGYWSKTLGYFVEVRMLTPEQAEERYEQLWEWFGDSDEYVIPEKFRPRRLRDRATDH